MKDIELTNFNVPLRTRQRFDAICRASGRTRTSVLVELMTNHILKEGRRLSDQQSELDKIDTAIGKSPALKRFSDWAYPDGRQPASSRLNSSDQELGMPEPLRSDGWEGW